jgi:8-oxo-dGTP diphosphatase
MRAGKDYIGVGVGAMVFNAQGQVFLAQRGPKAKNERGCWEFPGGSVEFGERLEAAIVREMREEYAIEIAVERLLHVVDHVIAAEGQHWVSPTYIARLQSGEPRIVEPEKCSAIGWFELSQLPAPLSLVTQDDLTIYLRQTGQAAIKALDHVQLAMPKGREAEARAFYGDLLGMHEIDKPEPLAQRGGCWFQSQSAQIHLGVEEPFAPARKAHPAFLVSDLSSYLAKLEAAGQTITSDNSVAGVRRAFINDPFGNRIELIQDGDGFNQ